MGNPHFGPPPPGAPSGSRRLRWAPLRRRPNSFFSDHKPAHSSARPIANRALYSSQGNALSCRSPDGRRSLEFLQPSGSQRCLALSSRPALLRRRRSIESLALPPNCASLPLPFAFASYSAANGLSDHHPRVPHLRDGLIVAKVGSAAPQAKLPSSSRQPTLKPNPSASARQPQAPTARPIPAQGIALGHPPLRHPEALKARPIAPAKPPQTLDTPCTLNTEATQKQTRSPAPPGSSHLTARPCRRDTPFPFRGKG